MAVDRRCTIRASAVVLSTRGRANDLAVLYGRRGVRAKVDRVAPSEYTGLPGVGVGAKGGAAGRSRRFHRVLVSISSGREVRRGGCEDVVGPGRQSVVRFQSVCSGGRVAACAAEVHNVRRRRSPCPHHKRVDPEGSRGRGALRRERLFFACNRCAGGKRRRRPRRVESQDIRGGESFVRAYRPVPDEARRRPGGSA